MRPCALFDVLSSNSGHTNTVSPRNNNVPIHVRSYQMLHVCFFVQIHPSICFSSYEAVCRLVAQNSNHRKSVILYLVITLSVNVSPGTQFHPSWVKVINNLLIFLSYLLSLIHSSLTQRGKYKDEKYCMTYFLRNGADCIRIPGTFTYFGICLPRP